MNDNDFFYRAFNVLQVTSKDVKGWHFNHPQEKWTFCTSATRILDSWLAVRPTWGTAEQFRDSYIGLAK